MQSANSNRIIMLSERLYRRFLFVYPVKFREAYGLEMAQTFRDCCREALQRAGTPGLLQLWSDVLYDLAATAFTEHVRAWIALFKRLSGLEKEYQMAIPSFQLDVALRTDIGRTRANNEDKMISVIPTDEQVLAQKGALFVVADGLGGHARGEVASELAVTTIRDVYYREGGDDIAAALSQAMKEANSAIYQLASQETGEKSMGSTAIAAVLHGDRLYVANVGDSRVYIVRSGQVRQISQDHSWVAEQVRLGAMTEEQARADERRNQIYRCLGTSADVEVDLFTEPVQDGDILVLCTDGLSGLVTDAEIGEIVEHYGSEESVQRLVARANENGGPDNITAVVARVSLG
jgi:PPM family protein phosphatase